MADVVFAWQDRNVGHRSNNWCQEKLQVKVFQHVLGISSHVVFPVPRTGRDSISNIAVGERHTDRRSSWTGPAPPLPSFPLVSQFFLQDNLKNNLGQCRAESRDQTTPVYSTWLMRVLVSSECRGRALSKVMKVMFSIQHPEQPPSVTCSWTPGFSFPYQQARLTFAKHYGWYEGLV